MASSESTANANSTTSSEPIIIIRAPRKDQGPSTGWIRRLLGRHDALGTRLELFEDEDGKFEDFQVRALVEEINEALDLLKRYHKDKDMRSFELSMSARARLADDECGDPLEAAEALEERLMRASRILMRRSIVDGAEVSKLVKETTRKVSEYLGKEEERKAKREKALREEDDEEGGVMEEA